MSHSGFSRFFTRQGGSKDRVGAPPIGRPGDSVATYFKKLVNTEDIRVCRIQYGSHIYRIFCFFDSHALIVLTHGFEKKSMKTPRQEIERAESYRREYLNRKGKKK